MQSFVCFPKSGFKANIDTWRARARARALSLNRLAACAIAIGNLVSDYRRVASAAWKCEVALEARTFALRAPDNGATKAAAVVEFA